MAAQVRTGVGAPSALRDKGVGGLGEHRVLHTVGEVPTKESVQMADGRSWEYPDGSLQASARCYCSPP